MSGFLFKDNFSQILFRRSVLLSLHSKERTNHPDFSNGDNAEPPNSYGLRTDFERIKENGNIIRTVSAQQKTARKALWPSSAGNEVSGNEGSGAGDIAYQRQYHPEPRSGLLLKRRTNDLIQRN